MGVNNKVKETEIEIKGIKIQGKGLYSEGPYTVFVGYIESDTNKDIPHYLIVNTEHWVVEGSAARIFEARGMCSLYARELEDQDKLIKKGEDILKRYDDNSNNPDRGWKNVN